MSVSHLASSESHAGTTGSTNQGSVPLESHARRHAARRDGVCLDEWQCGPHARDERHLCRRDGAGRDGGRSEPHRIVGGEHESVSPRRGRARRRARPRCVVSRTNNAVIMWAVCVTQSADGDTEIYEPGIYLDVSAGAAVERLVEDAGTGSASIRYYAAHWPIPRRRRRAPTPRISRALTSGPSAGLVGVETVPGTGSRLVGLAEARSQPESDCAFRRAGGVCPAAERRGASRQL